MELRSPKAKLKPEPIIILTKNNNNNNNQLPTPITIPNVKSNNKKRNKPYQRPPQSTSTSSTTTTRIEFRSKNFVKTTTKTILSTKHKLLLAATLLILAPNAATSTISTRPSSGRATLIPGQSLHFQCDMVDNNEAQFLWYRRSIGQDEGQEELLDPGEDSLEIHNERLTIHRPTNQLAGDYICRALSPTDKAPMLSESATIKVRTQPFIEDFGLETGHTGKSSIITDGDRLELTCTVKNSIYPVNITWLRSMTPDDEHTMVPLPETGSGSSQSSQSQQGYPPPPPLLAPDQAFIAQDQNILIESIGNNSKRLIIESVKQEHRSYYVCLVDNGVTERSRKIIFIRVKDKLVALWPFLGIVAELFILFTIIHVWETQRAYKEIHSAAPPPAAGQPALAGGGAAAGAPGPSAAGGPNKRPASGASVAFESVPLTSGGGHE